MATSTSEGRGQITRLALKGLPCGEIAYTSGSLGAMQYYMVAKRFLERMDHGKY